MTAGMISPSFELTVVPLIPVLRSVAMQLTRNEDAAGDLVQDTLTRAWKYWATFDGASPSAWLRTIMRNENIARWRKASRLEVATSVVHTIVDESMLADDVCDAIRDRALVGEAIDELPPGQMLAVWSVDIEGYSYKEAADFMECPIGTVMSRLHRGRIALRAILAERIGETAAA